MQTHIVGISRAEDRIELSINIYAGALAPGSTLITWNRAYVALVTASLVLHAFLFRRLYCSDPGWVNPGGGPGVEEGMPRHKCPHCGAYPPERSRHDFNTGASPFADHLFCSQKGKEQERVVVTCQ